MSRIPSGLNSIIESYKRRNPGNVTRYVEDLNDSGTSFIMDLARRHSVQAGVITTVFRHQLPESKRRTHPLAMIIEFEGDTFSLYVLADEKRGRWWSKIHWNADGPFSQLDLFVEA